MDEIVTERSEGVLRVQLNRPAKKNALTSRMYVTLADTFNQAERTKASVSCSGMAQAILFQLATMSRTS